MTANGYYCVPFRIEVVKRDGKEWSEDATLGTGIVTHILLQDLRFAKGTSGPIQPYIQDKSGSATISEITIKGLRLDGILVSGPESLQVGHRVRKLRIFPE
jgi:hypothetical protein